MNDRRPNGVENLYCVAEQMDALATGEALFIDCPYCGGKTVRGGDFCCGLMAKAFEAVMDRREQVEVTKTMDEILQRHLDS